MVRLGSTLTVQDGTSLPLNFFLHGWPFIVVRVISGLVFSTFRFVIAIWGVWLNSQERYITPSCDLALWYIPFVKLKLLIGAGVESTFYFRVALLVIA